MKNEKRVYIYDTTLRDGGQTSFVSFTAQDKLEFISALQDLKVSYIEAGWPGANQVDNDVFDTLCGAGGGDLHRQDVNRRGRQGSDLASAVEKASGAPQNLTDIQVCGNISAFGMTKRYGSSNENDINLANIVNGRARFATIVGKTWDFHVSEALGITNQHNLEIIQDSIAYLVSKGIETMFDAEHFFDGFKANPKYALQCIELAHKAGSKWIVLCDTNGGTLPHEIAEIIISVRKAIPNINLGIHAHNDTECAVANTIAAVQNGVRLVQGTINGLGERCGNANLCSIIPSLQLKLGYDCGIALNDMPKLLHISRKLDTIINQEHQHNLPYVGSSAFTHKGGLHASAVLKNPSCYEHINPEIFGNKRKVVISNQSGKSNIISMLNQIGLSERKYLDKVDVIVSKVKQFEEQGYSFEDADASFEIFVRNLLNEVPEFFKITNYKCLTESMELANLSHSYGQHESSSQSTVGVLIDGKESIVTANGNGPVNSLDNAIRKALYVQFPNLKNITLTDYKVRIISIKNNRNENNNKEQRDNEHNNGTKSFIKVNITSEDSTTGKQWSTTGISQNIIEASFNAIIDSVIFSLLATNVNQK